MALSTGDPFITRLTFSASVDMSCLTCHRHSVCCDRPHMIQNKGAGQQGIMPRSGDDVNLMRIAATIIACWICFPHHQLTTGDHR